MENQQVFPKKSSPEHEMGNCYTYAKVFARNLLPVAPYGDLISTALRQSMFWFARFICQASRLVTSSGNPRWNSELNPCET